MTYGLTDLSDNLIVYFDEHTHDIFNSATFKELSAAALSFVLKSSNLKMDEYDIYMSIRSWATVNSVRFFFLQNCFINFLLYHKSI